MTPREAEGYGFKFKLGNMEWETKQISKKKDDYGLCGVNFNRWGTRELLKWDLPYDCIDDMGYFFIYLVKKNVQISYQKFNVRDF